LSVDGVRGDGYVLGMARLARVVVPGVAHHVTQRGVRSMDVFSTDADRAAYLRLMAEHGRAAGLIFVSWCLMTNHVHLIVVPDGDVFLARGVGEAHGRYTRLVNFREGVRGYLFQGRFFSCPLDEPHAMAAVRYVERNPVRAGLVGHAWDWPWSSAAFHVGLVDEDPLVSERESFGPVHDWRALLSAEPEASDRLRRHVRTGRRCASRSFVETAERLLGRRLRPRPAGRPRTTRKYVL